MRCPQNVIALPHGGPGHVAEVRWNEFPIRSSRNGHSMWTLLAINFECQFISGSPRDQPFELCCPFPLPYTICVWIERCYGKSTGRSIGSYGHFESVRHRYRAAHVAFMIVHRCGLMTTSRYTGKTTRTKLRANSILCNLRWHPHHMHRTATHQHSALQRSIHRMHWMARGFRFSCAHRSIETPSDTAQINLFLDGGSFAADSERTHSHHIAWKAPVAVAYVIDTTSVGMSYARPIESVAYAQYKSYAKSKMFRKICMQKRKRKKNPNRKIEQRSREFLREPSRFAFLLMCDGASFAVRVNLKRGKNADECETEDFPYVTKTLCIYSFSPLLAANTLFDVEWLTNAKGGEAIVSCVCVRACLGVSAWWLLHVKSSRNQ